MWFKIKCIITKIYCWLTFAIPIVVISSETDPGYTAVNREYRYVKVARMAFNSLRKYGYKLNELEVSFKQFRVDGRVDTIIVLLSPNGSCDPTNGNGINRPKTYIHWYHLNKAKRTEQILRYG